MLLAVYSTVIITPNITQSALCLDFLASGSCRSDAVAQSIIHRGASPTASPTDAKHRQGIMGCAASSTATEPGPILPPPLQLGIADTMHSL